jgi:putative DNA primase/helicase
MNNDNDTAAQFAQAIKDAGLILDGLPTMDGFIHRVPVTNDKHGEKSGSYAGHLEGRKPGGYIQNFKTGEVVNWKADGSTPELTPAERARIAIESVQRRKDREAEKLAENSATAVAAQALWKEAPPANASNAYCKEKGILFPGASGLRVVPSSVSPECAAHGIKIARTVKEAQEVRKADPEARVFKTGDLLVPGSDIDGKLWTLQSINPNFKSFMKGGRKHDLFAIAGTSEVQKEKYLQTDKAPLVVAEGYATADTISRLLGQPVIVAFDSGNLEAVTRELRKQFPERSILIAADNDHEAPTKTDKFGKPLPNVGLLKANQAAIKHGCGVMIPPFAAGDKGTDWNDLAAIHGDAVTKQILTSRMTGAKLEADGSLATIKAESDRYERLERQHLGDPDKGTGIYGVGAALTAAIKNAFDQHLKCYVLNDKQQVPTKNASHERGGFEI